MLPSLESTDSSNNNDSSETPAPKEATTNEEERTKMTMEKILPIRMVSKVVPGFGRGSRDLGIPTANLSSLPHDMKCRRSFESLPTGIYYGFARLSETEDDEEKKDARAASTERLRGIYKAAISIGYNPCYNNRHKTIEPHLIAPPGHPSRNISACGETQFCDLYNETMRLSIAGYLRPELPFDGLDKLILAIKGDITKTEDLCDDVSNSMAKEEKDWVLSEEDV